jgi:hypothetical protein
MTTPVGKSDENPKIRWSRYRDHVKVYDLMNAGKKGKTVDMLLFSYIGGTSDKPNYRLEILLDEFTSELNECDYVDALSLAASLAKKFNMSVKETRVDAAYIPPAISVPIRIRGKNVDVTADLKKFTVQNLHGKNMQVMISSGRESAERFYRWARENMESLKTMTNAQVAQELRREGIVYDFPMSSQFPARTNLYG